MRVLDVVRPMVYCAVGGVQRSETVWRQANKYKFRALRSLTKWTTWARTERWLVDQNPSGARTRFRCSWQLVLAEEGFSPALLTLVKQAINWNDADGRTFEYEDIPATCRFANEWHQNLIGSPQKRYRRR